MGQETIISMNYEFNLLGLSTQLVGVEKEAFPMILDAPTLVEIIEEEEKAPWWKKGLSAVGNTLKNAIVPLAIGALVAGAIAIAAVVIVGTGGAGAILVAGAVAAGKAFAIGLAVTAVGATAGVATTAVYEAVTGNECSQAVYDQEAERWAKIAGLVYGAYNIGKLATSIQWTSTGPPMMELAGTGETFGGIASVVGDVDIAGVIEGIQGGVLGGAIWFAKSKGNSSGIKYPKSDKDFKKIFGVDMNTYHKEIKPEIIKDIRNSEEYSQLFYKVGKNPDIGIDNLGQIVLKNVKTKEELVTTFLFEWYIP